MVEALPPRGSLSSVLPKIELCWNLVPTKVLKRVVLSAINSVGTSQDEKMDRFCYHVPRESREGDSHMEWAGMLVVSLRGVNFGFWSRLGCCGQNVIIFSRQGLVKGCTRRNNKTERILILYIYSIHINKFAIIKSHCTFYLSVL